MSAQGAALGAERLESWGPGVWFFRPWQLSGVSLPGGVSGPWLRSVPAGGGGASRGPAGLSLRICSMGRPLCAPQPRSALPRGFWGPGSHILGARAHPARARDRHPRAGCPLKDEKMASGTVPAGTEWPRTCGGPETSLITARGGSPKQELGRAGRGHHPICPRPAQVRFAQVRQRAAARGPAGAPRPGLGDPEAAARSRRLGGRRARSM